MKKVLILTITGIYKNINISSDSFNKKYQKLDKKYPEDKRKNVYRKKSEYYEKENIPQNLRRIKKRSTTEYNKAKDKKTYSEYKKYIQSREEREGEIKERQTKLISEKEEEERRKAIAKKRQAEERIIRVWMKLKYNGNGSNSIFIESFIDGKQKDESTLKQRLSEFIMSNFGEEVGIMSEIGIEKIKKAEQKTPYLKYKHNLIGGWHKL